MYEERIIEAEKGSFTPLIFTTSGGNGPLCRVLIKKLAERIAESKNERYEDIIYHLRVRIRFSILGSTLISVRGQRGKNLKGAEKIEETSFNIIPEVYREREN